VFGELKLLLIAVGLRRLVVVSIPIVPALLQRVKGVWLARGGVDWRKVIWL
jgi:hypothetical protein